MFRKFRGTEESMSVPPCPGGSIYTVRSGDTMFLIARRFNIPLDRLIAANPQIADPNRIDVGDKICIPAREVPVRCPDGFLYTVRPGDTLFQLSARFEVSLQALIDANPQLEDPNRLTVGQVLCIPVTPRPPACPGGTIYTVMAGDTIFSIARKFNVSPDAIIAANPQLEDPDRIFAGQKLCIPRR